MLTADQTFADPPSFSPGFLSKSPGSSGADLRRDFLREARGFFATDLEGSDVGAVLTSACLILSAWTSSSDK